MTSTIRIVLQARMGSVRRPGKTLADVAGKPLLARCLERLEAAKRLGVQQHPRFCWELLVATSTSPGDDAVADVARRLGFACVHGSENDVLARYLTATADLRPDDLVIRATADNPLYCPERTVQLVEAQLAGDAVYTGIAEALSPLVPEVIQVGALRDAATRADVDDYCREHVTPYFRRPATPFAVQWLPQTWQGLDPDLRLTVDTPEDLANMNALYEALIALTGADCAAEWTQTQIYGTARGLHAMRAARPALDETLGNRYASTAAHLTRAAAA